MVRVASVRPGRRAGLGRTMTEFGAAKARIFKCYLATHFYRKWFDTTETEPSQLYETAADVRKYEVLQYACTLVHIIPAEELGGDDEGRARIEARKKRKLEISTGDDANVERTEQNAVPTPRTQRCWRVIASGALVPALGLWKPVEGQEGAEECRRERRS